MFAYHDDRLRHEEEPQLADVQVQQRQLNEDEQEKAQELLATDMMQSRVPVPKPPQHQQHPRALLRGHHSPPKTRPNRLNHHTQTLPSLETLRPKPNHRHSTSDKHRKFTPVYPKRTPTVHRKVDAQVRSHVPVQHSGNADERMSDENGEDGQSWVQAGTDRGRGDLVH